jgi:hypothetical protein
MVGTGEVLDGRVVLEVVPIDRRFWSRGLGVELADNT